GDLEPRQGRGEIGRRTAPGIESSQRRRRRSGHMSSQRGYTTCGELRASDSGKSVVLNGWVNRQRDHGGLIFLDLRDRYGITQVVCNPEDSPEAHAVAEGIRSEYVVQVTRNVRMRPEGTENPRMATGEIEVEATEVTIVNAAK